MSQIDRAALEKALDQLPQDFRGPGGVAGIVADGEVVAARAWGYRDMDRRLEMTTGTRLPICSISKQFTCMVALEKLGDLDAYDDRLPAYLPAFRTPLPRLRQMADNQSGLRDYWALSVLAGAHAEGTFAREDALPLIARMKTGHFAPGSRYSYCNPNFRLIYEILAAETGRPLEALYREVIFDPAGMERAHICADTRHPDDGVLGYEGIDATGFFPADNGMFWIGDAGISATLEDMLAYEAWIDAGRGDAAHPYRRISGPPQFADGTPARYGYGLGHETVAGMAATGHGGALRGFRAHRLHAAEARLSVVVIFNHEADAHGAAVALMEAALGWQPAARRPAPVPAALCGSWLCKETGLLAVVQAEGDPALGAASLAFATGRDRLRATPDGALAGSGGLRLDPVEGGLRMTRPGENLTSLLVPLASAGTAPETADGTELAGCWHAGELEARMTITSAHGATFAGFEGQFGTGPMERMHPAGRDVWIITTRRSMDAPAPGDWTVRVSRDAQGVVSGLRLGCWLARDIAYDRAD